jgi:hypothetical protein
MQRQTGRSSATCSSSARVDAGDGWLVFSLPPAELAAHPIDGDADHELYLMCEDVRATVEELSCRAGVIWPSTSHGTRVRSRSG